jgi:hypothetical protein
VIATELARLWERFPNLLQIEYQPGQDLRVWLTHRTDVIGHDISDPSTWRSESFFMRDIADAPMRASLKKFLGIVEADPDHRLLDPISHPGGPPMSWMRV